MASRESRVARVSGPGTPPAKWVGAREARAAEGGLRAPFRRRGPRPGHSRMSRIDTKEHQKWIA
jgi:hypothetical protein